jgi:hypothetical protein
MAGDNAAAPLNGIAGHDLLSAEHHVLAFEYEAFIPGRGRGDGAR